MPDLAESVDQLIHDHKKTIHTIDGMEIHDRPSLLEQLHAAIFGGMEKTGGSGSKAKLPVSEAALDLHELIDQQITEAWAATFNRVPSATTPSRLLAEWSAAVKPDVIVVVTRPEQHERWNETKERPEMVVIRVREEHKPADLASRWVDLIEDFLNPERTAGIQAPCIQCGQSKVTRRKDGETIETDALVFRRDKDTGRTLDARCLACGVIWPPSQFRHLMAALGVEDKEPEEEKLAREPIVVMSVACFDGKHDRCESINCRCAHHHDTPETKG